MTPLKWLAAVVGVLGLVALVVGIIYFTVPAHSLPNFMGYIAVSRPGGKAHHKRRGEAAIAAAVVLWVIGGILLYVDNRRNAPSTPSSTPSDQAAA